MDIQHSRVERPEPELYIPDEAYRTVGSSTPADIKALRAIAVFEFLFIPRYEAACQHPILLEDYFPTLLAIEAVGIKTSPSALGTMVFSHHITLYTGREW